MGDDVLRCPLCCDKVFRSKQLLIEHLSKKETDLICPVCNNKWTSLNHLIEHLSLDNCQPDNTVHSISFDNVDIQTYIDQNTPVSVESTTKTDDSDGIHLENAIEAQSLPDNEEKYDFGDVTQGENGMYVELLQKQLPGIPTKLALVKDNGESRFILMDTDNELGMDGTIVTKQNQDGTISLTTVEDMKMESDALILQSEDSEENQEELYSCNTCGVSFSSVVDHIQNYHNDQEVVVEEATEDGNSTIIDCDNLTSNNFDAVVEKESQKRVITETGDIVVAPLSVKPNLKKTQDPPHSENNSVLKHVVEDKDGQQFTRRLVQIDMVCDSLVKDINQPDGSKGPYHKVVVKECQTTTGETVKIFNCMTCHIYVKDLEEFKLHPCKKMKYYCAHCPVAYDNAKSLCAHMKVHKVKDPNSGKPVTFECAVCSTVFQTNKSLKLHTRMHDPIKSRPIEPPVENAEGTEVSNDKFLCSICNKVIPIDYRAIHQKSHDSSLSKTNCDICNKKFPSIEFLEMHMNVHNLDKVTVNRHDKPLPYTCLYCNRQFARPHEKVKHERIHTGEKPHSCEICGKSFRVSYCLTLHMRTHTGARPYACPHCGKRFKAHSVYNHHLLTHSDIRAYKCPYCPKAFKTSVQLAGHKNSHTKPFSCQQCNRPFASLYAVRVHMETHARQNNLKYMCALCGASYARMFALKDHVKQAHHKLHDDSKNFKDWLVKDTTEEDNKSPSLDDALAATLSKDMQSEINDLDMTTSELIIP